MPVWYFEKDELLDTPSVRDGIDRDTEARYRREGVRFIQDCGNSLKLFVNFFVFKIKIPKTFPG
jgi:hypothetical protein